MQQKFKLCGTGEGLWPHVPREQLPASLGLGGTLAFDWEAQLLRWEEEEARLLNGWERWDPTALLTCDAEVEPKPKLKFGFGLPLHAPARV